MDGLLSHLLVGTCQRLQCLIGIGVSLTTQDGLNGFSHYCPRILQVFLQLLLVEDELAQTFQRALDSDQGVTHRNTHIAQNGRIGEVALQTAYRQFLCQEAQHGIGDTHITL